MIKGKVVKIVTPHEFVADIGADDDVREDMEFIVYVEGDVIKDPETGEELDRLEYVKTRVQPKHIQENITTMETIETTTKQTGLSAITLSGKKEVPRNIADAPDDQIDEKVQVGDLVKLDTS